MRRADSASKLTEADVVDFVKSRVSKIKWITGGVRFIDEIPKNPVSGPVILDSSLGRSKLTELCRVVRYCVGCYGIMQSGRKG